MEHKLFIPEMLNNLALRLLHGLGIRVSGEVLPTHVVMALFSASIILVFFRLSARRISFFPGKKQSLIELFFGFVRSITDDFIGHEGRRFVPVLGTLFLFIVVSNLLGLFPEMGSPTANLNVPAGCALFIFVYYHLQGIKKHGIGGYLKTFCGPAWWMAPIFAPIEIISHFSRPLSLTIRLFCNIFGEDLVIIIIASLVPFIAPLPIMALAIITSILQGLIFMILSAIYLSGAVATEH